MEELFSGLAFAILRRIMPDFRPIFEAFLSGLEQAAENRILRKHIATMVGNDRAGIVKVNRTSGMPPPRRPVG